MSPGGPRERSQAGQLGGYPVSPAFYLPFCFLSLALAQGEPGPVALRCLCPCLTLTRAGGPCPLRRVRGPVVAHGPGACSPGRGPFPRNSGPPSSPEATGEKALAGASFSVVSSFLCVCGLPPAS